MKIIDLFNKIANGEEVPKKLKIKQWEYNGENENLEYELFDRLLEEDIELNDEVEILEEEKKIPEKIKDVVFLSNHSHRWTEEEKVIVRTINEIIDYFEYLKNKGDE